MMKALISNEMGQHFQHDNHVFEQEYAHVYRIILIVKYEY